MDFQSHCHRYTVSPYVLGIGMGRETYSTSKTLLSHPTAIFTIAENWKHFNCVINTAAKLWTITLFKVKITNVDFFTSELQEIGKVSQKGLDVEKLLNPIVFHWQVLDSWKKT